MSYKLIANVAYDCYEPGDTIIKGLDTYDAADYFACHHTFVHADAALAQEQPLVRIEEDCNSYDDLKAENESLKLALQAMLKALIAADQALNDHFGITSVDDPGDTTHDQIRAVIAKTKED